VLGCWAGSPQSLAFDVKLSEKMAAQLLAPPPGWWAWDHRTTAGRGQHLKGQELEDGLDAAGHVEPHSHLAARQLAIVNGTDLLTVDEKREMRTLGDHGELVRRAGQD